MANKARPALLAVSLIGACAVAFNTLASAAAAGELGKTAAVPTQYEALAGTAVPVTGGENYQKPSFSVRVHPTQTPDANAISADEAAEVGARMLYYTFSTDLTGAEIEMEYVPAGENIRRAYWEGRFTLEDTLYYFSVDAITGEEKNTQRNRTLKEAADLGFDLKLEQSKGAEYQELARQYAEKFRLVGETIKSVEYYGQGYINNDPTIDFEVLGSNGQKGRLSFSRHDQTLIGVDFNASVVEMEYFEKKVQQRAEEDFRNAQGQSSAGASDQLVPITLK